jgi:hypothetical protein
MCCCWAPAAVAGRGGGGGGAVGVGEYQLPGLLPSERDEEAGDGE